MAELKILHSLVDNRYQITERKSIGAYSEIFIARDQKNDDKPVIIKALNLQLQGTLDAELEQLLIKNFRNESEVLSQLTHANIIHKIDEGAATDLDGVLFYYITLEYLSGGDLLQRCKQQPLSLAEVTQYLRQICAALDYAHAHNIIHRDIKPNNLLLSADGAIVKIADFGIAKINRADTEDVTRVGSNCYAPPEHHPSTQIENLSDNQLTPAADVYALAKTVYVLLTGHAPYQFEGKPITELPAEFAGEPWASGLLAVLMRATNIEISARYQSADEFYQAVEQVWQESEEITRVRPTRAAMAAAPIAPMINEPVHRSIDAPIVVPLPDNSPAFVPVKDHSKKYLALLSLALILAFSLLAYSYYRPLFHNENNNAELDEIETRESLPTTTPSSNSDKKLIKTNQDVTPVIDLSTPPKPAPITMPAERVDIIEPLPNLNKETRESKEIELESKPKSSEAANEIINPIKTTEPIAEPVTEPKEESVPITEPQESRPTPTPSTPVETNPNKNDNDGNDGNDRQSLPPAAAPTEVETKPDTPKLEKSTPNDEIDLRKEPPEKSPGSSSKNPDDDEIDLRKIAPKEDSTDNPDME